MERIARDIEYSIKSSPPGAGVPGASSTLHRIAWIHRVHPQVVHPDHTLQDIGMGLRSERDRYGKNCNNMIAL